MGRPRFGRQTRLAYFASASIHGGQESTLLTMMVPLLHHGMLIQGLPHSLPALNQTRSGGTPYGVTHLQGSDDPAKLSEEEASLAVAAGTQLAQTALRLNSTT